MDRQIDRQTDTHTHTHADTHARTHTHSHTHRHTQTHTHTHPQMNSLYYFVMFMLPAGLLAITVILVQGRCLGMVATTASVTPPVSGLNTAEKFTTL